jgi:3-oxoacyl-[acyl-carrier protein] reductase
MLLENKSAVLYGAGGAVGTAVAKAFAREGARLFLSGRNIDPVADLAADISSAAGSAEAAQVDALDAEAVEAHLARVVETAGRVDISFNLIGIGDVQGAMLVDVVPEELVRPVQTAVHGQITTAGAAARQMVRQGRGVILFLTATPARLPIPATGDFAIACAALESLSRQFAGARGRAGGGGVV